MVNDNIDEAKVSDGQRKVTLGFKCMPSLKAELSKIAESKGLTLSAYVESLLNNFSEKNEKISFLITENQKIQDRIAQVSKRLSIYENDYLHELFTSHANKKVIYTNKKGESVEKEILNLSDIYEVIINSFQYTVS